MRPVPQPFLSPPQSLPLKSLKSAMVVPKRPLLPLPTLLSYKLLELCPPPALSWLNTLLMPNLLLLLITLPTLSITPSQYLI